MSLTWTILLTLATFAPGLYLLRRGLKGKLLDNHPLCRRCQFDLFNKPSDSTRCPECGSDLALPNSTLPGHRQRRPVLITLGSFFLLPPLTFAIILSAGVRIDWIKLEPTWLLTSKAQSADPATRAPAINELCLRARAGSLSPAQLSTLAGIALQIQYPTDPRWEYLLELANASNALTPSQQQAYTQRMLQRIGVFEKSIVVNSARLFGDTWSLDLAHAPPPFPLAFDVTIRNGENQWSGGTLMCDPRAPASHAFVDSRAPQSRQPIVLDQPNIDIILHPNPALSPIPTALRSIPLGDIALKKIPVDDPVGDAHRRELAFRSALKQDHSKQIARIKEAKGVILRVQSRHVAASAAAGAASGVFRLVTGVSSPISADPILVPPKDSIELLIFPGLPFQSRFKVDGGFITIQGELQPGRDESSFSLRCRLTEEYSDGDHHSRGSFENTLPASIGDYFTLGISNTTSWSVALVAPDDPDTTTPQPATAPKN